MNQAYGIQSEYMATTATGRWSTPLWDEMEARGWKPRFVDRTTGLRMERDHRDAKRLGVWTFRFCGYDTDGAVTYARMVKSIKVRKKAS